MFGDIKIAVGSDISFQKEWSDFRVFAIRCHGKQMYGEMPYASHLALVEHYLVDHGYTEHHYQASAWLHDVLEDTDASIDKIHQNYGPIVAGIVFSCTGEGLNRKARVQSIYAKLSKYPLAAPVKVADRLANMIIAYSTARNTYDTEKLEMYLSEWDGFRKHVFPLVADSRRGRMLWESLDSLSENAKNDVAELKARGAKLNEEREQQSPPSSSL
jgi:hypothetical protein